MKATDPKHVDRLKRAVEASFGATLDSPTDYDRMSADILARTGERISPSTLKRLFGYTKPATSPRPSTLSALARYVGYAGWSDFCSGQIEKTPEAKSDKSRTFRRMAYLLAVTGLLVGIASIAYRTTREPVVDDYREDRKYELLLEECLTIARGKCDSVRSCRGKMDIISYKDLVDSVYYPFVFGLLKERIDTRVGEMFAGDHVRATRYRNEIFALCREVCAELMREIPAEEISAAYREREGLGSTN